MFWMPAPGTTLMLNFGFLLLTSSTKPPACAYQPPPICPAVQVRSYCWASAGAAQRARASARTSTVNRRMVPPPAYVAFTAVVSTP